MANRWAIANGNWSNASTWSGSLIPTSADDVFANNRTITVDTSFEVLTLRNSASASAVTAGGSFVFNSGSISGSCTSATTALVAAATNLIQVTAITGNITLSFGSSITGIASANIILHSGDCDLLLSGSSFGGSVTSTNGNCINKTSNGTITIIGSVNGGAGNSNQGLVSTAGNTIITGSVLGGTNGSAIGVIQNTGNLFVSGNVTGRTGNSNGSAINFSGIQLGIIGNITAGNVQTGVTSTATVITVSGSCFASADQPAIVNSNTTALNVFTGPFINSGSTMAIQCINAVLEPSSNPTWNFGNTILYPANQLPYYPSSSDVRQGVSYVDGTVTGSLKMPPPTAVISGTPTDNTTGSAIITSTQLQEAMWSKGVVDMNETGSIGYRLAKSATPTSTGTQISSYLL